MDPSKYEKLKKDVNYMNEEGFVPEGQQLRVYRNADELINAIRNNEVPGIVWTPEDDIRWQLENTLEESLTEETNEVWNKELSDDEGYYFG